MPKKPPFDPNKPFEEVRDSKPAFDPNKAFEVVEETPQQPVATAVPGKPQAPPVGGQGQPLTPSTGQVAPSAGPSAPLPQAGGPQAAIPFSQKPDIAEDPEPTTSIFDKYSGPETVMPGMRPFSASGSAPRTPRMMPTAGSNRPAAKAYNKATEEEKKKAEDVLFTYRSDFTPQATRDKAEAMRVISGDEAANAYMTEEIGRIKSIELPKRKELLMGVEQGVVADKKALEQAADRLKQNFLAYQQQAKADPSIAAQLQSQYDQELSDVQGMAKSLEMEAAQLGSLYEDLKKDAILASGYEYLQRAKTGTRTGATWNNLLNNVGGTVAGGNALLAMPILAMSPATPLPGETQEQANVRVKNKVLSAMREAPNEAIGDSGTTPEYIQEMQDTFLGGAWLAGSGTIPLALMGPAGLGMIFNAGDAVRQEMSAPEFDNIPEWKKEVFSNSVGLVIGMLEKYGIQQAMGGGKMARSIMANAISKLPQNATTADIKAFLLAETDNVAANYLARIGGGAIPEAGTEFQQGIIEPALKEVFDMVEGKNLLASPTGDRGFKSPASLGEVVRDALVQSAQGAVMGGMMATPGAVLKHLRDSSVGKTTNNTQFELTEQLLKDPEFLATIKEDLARRVEDKDITQTEADETISAWKEAQQIVAKIPEDLQTEKRREAFDLLTQKAKLSKMDKALVGDKVAAIDAKLMKLAGVEPETNAEGEAKPAPTATQADIDAATGVTEEVDPVVKTGEDLQLAEAPMIATGNAFGNPPSGIRFFHGTTKESADSIRSSGFTGTAGKRTRSAGIDTDGVFLYPNDPDAAMEFAKNHDGDTEVIEARVDGRIYNSDDGIKKAPNGRYLDELVDEAYGWENDLQITEIAKDKSIIDQLRRDGYVAVTAPELGIPVTFVFDLSAVSANSKPDSSQRTGAQQLTTPQQDATQQATGGRPLSSQSLRDAFGYTKEVADATEAIADAMGLDKSKIKVVKGGEAGEGALMQDETGGWYSRLDQMAASRGNTQSGSDWMKWAEARAKEGMLSMEEAKWTGLSDWLASKGSERVTPQQVRDFLKENRVKVEIEVLVEGEGKTAKERFSSEDLELPGGTNYREVLIKTPVRMKKLPDGFVVRQKENGTWKVYDERWGRKGLNMVVVYDDATTRERAIELALDELANEPEFGFFHNHYPGIKNILVHLRLNDRTGPNGEKVLFVEELQSDWGQKGKKDGFKATPVSAKTHEIIQVGKSFAIAKDKDSPMLASFMTLDQAEDALASGSIEAQGGAPTAPFITSTEAWTELGIKQAIRMAVEGGYDRIAWTTGEQQNERYDLSKQVDRIKWDQHGWAENGDRMVIITMPGGVSHQFSVDGNGLVRGSARLGADGKRLDEVVGKDMADKIMSEAGGDLSGDGLKVGGSGMKGFYDKILPAAAKKVAKKLGGDGVVSDVQIPVGVRADITRRDGGITLNDDVGTIDSTQQSITITDAMRAKVQQGVPLMQDAKGAVEFAEGGDAIIRALQNPDASTGIHELAHVARRFLLDRNVPQENRLGITDAHIETAEQWSGAKDGNWTREAEEKFARGFERYLRDGNAPNEALKDVFAKFKQWLTDIYRNLFNSPVKEMVSPEMRKVFDALVTRGPQQTKAPRTAETTVATKANDAAPEPAAPPPAEPAKPEPKEPSRPMRGSAKRMKEQYPELYAALGDDTIYYDRLPMTVTRDAASELVGWLGLERAKDEVLNRSSDIPDAVRAMMGRMVMRKLADEHRLAELDTFAENFFKLGTSAGQFINALRDVYEEFSKEMIFYRVQKIVEKEVERKKGKDKNYKKLRDGLEKVNKEVVEEVVRTRKVREKTNEAAAPQQKQSGSEKIRKAWNWDKNKVVKKDRKAEILKALRGTFGTGPNPLYVELAAGYVEAGARTFAAVAEVVASELGNKAVPYFKEAYKKAFKFLKDQGVDAGEPSTDAEIDEEIARFNTKAMVDQLRKAIASNDKKTAAELIGKLQQTAKDFDAWGLYKEYAVSRLKRMADREIAEDLRVDDDVREFADGLVRNITDQMKKEAAEKGLEPKEPKKPKPAIEIIGDAYRNFEKYEQVWKDTQAEWKRRLNAAEARLAKANTSEAKQKAQADIAKEQSRLDKLDAYYGELLVKPFSEAAIGRAVKDGMKQLDMKIDAIIRRHYTDYEAAKRTLAEKLVADAGLTEPEATKLANAVKAEFDSLATERKKALVEQYAKRKFGAKKARAEKKGIEEELILLTNTGAFSEKDFISKYGELRGWPKLTEENVREIERLADRIQTVPEGRPRLEAIEDLLSYQENLSGVSKWEIAQSVWFANMLSGFETQEVNLLANQFNLMMELGVAAAKKPKDTLNLARVLGYGFKRGWYEAGAVMSTGYSPIRGRVDIPPALERYKFPSYMFMYGGLKYVRRVMVAADVLGFEPLKEMRAYQYAAMKSRSMDPSPIDMQKALDLLNRDDDSIEQAKQQAEAEYKDDVKSIEARGLSGKELREAMDKAARDRKRRAFELVERGRDPEVLQESSRFAARSTFNYTPEGFLGAIAKNINGLLRDIPALRYVIPFVNIIANVSNEALNYYPLVGVARAAAGGSITDTIMGRANKGMTDAQKQMHRGDLAAKAAIGIVLQAALLILSDPGDDDDPFIEVTSNGYGNYRQNAEMEAKGLWKPYSFRLRGTDTWISYQYTPLLFAFGHIGHLRDAEKYRKERLTDEWYTKYAVSMKDNIGTIADASFLATTADALGWLTSTTEEGLDGLSRSMARIVKAMAVPYSALLSQMQQNMEATFGVPKIDARGSMTAELIKNTPVAYFVRDNYPVMIDALGDPILPTGGSLRRFMSTSDPDPSLLKKLFMAAPAPDRFWSLMVDKKYPLSAPNRNTVTVYDEQEDKERLLTDQELMTFYQKRGALIKEALNDDFEALSAMDNKEFAEEMKSIQTYASEEAKWVAAGGE